jgi:5-bromo-4-chloroindolyl phosphate hydrolysis protein
VEQKTIKSALPIYLCGASFLIYALIFPFYRITDYIIALCVSAAVYLAGKKLARDKVTEVPVTVKFERTGVKDADELLAGGRANLEKLSGYNARISDPEITARLNELSEIGADIFAYVAKWPESARQVRTFTEYYFPTLLKLLDTYADITENKIQGPSADANLKKIGEVLPQFVTAFKKQLDILYENRTLDTETDISVLQGVLKKEGLL